MKPDKSKEEALFRSHQATEKANQAQSQLYSMGTGQQEADQSTKPQTELHESPRNLLQSWDTLRQLDNDLAGKEAGSPATKRGKEKNGTHTKQK